MFTIAQKLKENVVYEILSVFVALSFNKTKKIQGIFMLVTLLQLWGL